MQDHGAPLVFGDSPNLSSRPLAAARKCGLLAEAQALGIPLVDFENGVDVSYPQGVQDRRFHVARGVLESGPIVNLPRLKTHTFTVMTGALKNIFGVVPGGRKAELHLSHSTVEEFSRMIADLNGLVPSRLVVLDAIRAMQGNGPGSGELVDVGLLIISDDPSPPTPWAAGSWASILCRFRRYGLRMKTGLATPTRSASSSAESRSGRTSGARSRCRRAPPRCGCRPPSCGSRGGWWCRVPSSTIPSARGAATASLHAP